MIFSSPEHPDRYWGPPSLIFDGYLGIFTWGVEWLGGWGMQFDHLLPSCVRVKSTCSCNQNITSVNKKEGSYASASPICPHSVLRDNFTLQFFKLSSVHICYMSHQLLLLSLVTPNNGCCTVEISQYVVFSILLLL